MIIFPFFMMIVIIFHDDHDDDEDDSATDISGLKQKKLKITSENRDDHLKR